ncbi:dipeptidase [Algoriphagus boseongensis]|uniref:Dipeptidase n=1 Tax=Algoriphagus boseongensis TaxID=1442587 RepID=A0A4R6TDA2_9BACT|nr:carcinine hydrolase/isopenicillin-N N-acyltransferase family protein [Algoriphagus boseongensis]TDQ19434.1 dipeptidase [Algoriphagus boseongensis]
MCDTLVALPNQTASGNLIFGKNSDREPLEAQAVVHVPRTSHSNSNLQCTFRSIPQVEQTYEVILSKPFQMWGAEMGANEWGVVIGNEAVFTNVKINKKELGLMGMDLLRLALERTKTAQEALRLIIQLLETYGQNACGGYQNRNFYYHNSFLIADPEKAYILETAGKSWTFKKVIALGSISNGLSIEEDYEEVSFKEEPKTIQRFFSGKKPNFKNYFSDLIYTKAGRPEIRKACTLNFISTSENSGVSDFMGSLRQHNLEDFHPKKATTGSVCMHATGFTNPSDTTGSMVAEIRKGKPSTLWLTGTPHPCISLYVPFYFGCNLNHPLLNPSAKPDQSLWWKAKAFQKKILLDYSKKQPELRAKWDEIQKDWIKKDQELIHGNATKQELAEFSLSCLKTYENLLGG